MNLLGQNLLTNSEIAKRIVVALDIRDGDFVVEVGPGQGALTDFLVEKPVSLLLAIEKDYKLVEFLRKKYGSRKKIKIVHNDVLRIDRIVIPTETEESLKNTKGSLDGVYPELVEWARDDERDYKLISNLPYSITSFFINKFFVSGEMEKPEKAVLMVQKEVAERLTSKPGEKNRGILSVLLQACCEVEKLFDVARENFTPTPGVESAVIKIIPRKKNLDPRFIALVKAGFSAKRQKLANSLSQKLEMPKTEIADIIKSAGISENARAEDLGVNEWEKLVNRN